MWGGVLCICVHKMLHICAGVTRGQKRKSDFLGQELHWNQSWSLKRAVCGSSTFNLPVIFPTLGIFCNYLTLFIACFTKQYVTE